MGDLPKGLEMYRRTLFKLVCLAASAALAAAWAATADAQTTSGQVAGSVTLVSNNQFTIQTPGKPVGVLAAINQAANRVAAQDLPYVWGGGHAQAGIASRGEKGGPGYNGKRIGYDCSGAVAAVLVGAGLWPSGSGVPNDAGVIQYLLSHHLIARGAGTGPTEVTLYDNPGVHIFMNIDGRFWGTSDGGAGANSKGGAGWLDDGAWDSTRPQFRRYHVLASVLKAKTTAGYSFTFASNPVELAALGIGSKVSVKYSTSKYGTMVASSITYTNQSTTAGSVTAIGAGGASFTVHDVDGQSVTFQVAAGSSVAGQIAAGQIAVGAVVEVSYQGTLTSGSNGTSTSKYTALSVTVTAPPPPPEPGGVGTTTTISGGSGVAS